MKKGDFIQMEKKGGAEKFFCSLMHPTYAKESKWTLFADNLVTLLPYMNKEYKDNIETLSQCDKEMTDLMHMIEGSRIGIFFYIRYYWKIRKNRRIRRECKVNLEIIDQIRETLRFNFRGLNMMQESLDNIYYPIYNYRTDWTVDQNRLVDTLTAHCQ